MTRRQRLVGVAVITSLVAGFALLFGSPTARVHCFSAVNAVGPEPLRIWAGRMLMEEGPLASGALLLALDDKSEFVRQQLGAELAIRSEGSRILARIAVRGSRRARLTALKSLAHSGDLARILPMLRLVLDDPSAELRERALSALAHLRGQAAPAWPELCACLARGGPKEALLAAVVLEDIAQSGALKKLSPAPRQALLEALLGALKSPVSELRWHAAQIMLELPERDPRMALPLGEGLSSVSPAMVAQSALGLVLLGRKAADAVMPLTKALSLSPPISDNACFSVIQALGGIGPAANRAVPALSRVATKSPQERLRGAAIVALGKIAPHRDEVVDTLLTTSRDPADDVRALAVLMLGQCSEHRRRVIPPLQASLRDPAPQVRDCAKRGLAALGVR